MGKKKYYRKREGTEDGEDKQGGKGPKKETEIKRER